MEWTKIKLIFISVLLVLNLFLFIEYRELRFDFRQTTFIPKNETEEKIANIALKYENIEKNNGNISKISAKPVKFKEVEIEDSKFIVDTNNHGESSTIKKTFVDKSFVFDPNLPKEQIIKFVGRFVEGAEKYNFFNYDKNENTLTFYQSYNGLTFYKSDEARLIVYLNEANEVLFYTSSSLTNFEKLGEEKVAVPLVKILNLLFKKEELSINSNVSSIKFGYFSRIPSYYIYEPTWIITVDNKTFYVGALNGDIY